MTGKVYLVGAGPGAPDLITVRGADILRRADVVFHDALVHPDVIALAVRAEKIAVGKRCGQYSTAQQFINKRLLDAVQSHAVVVRLKGGDPMLFGRAHEEIEALQAAGIDFEVVPGVTAALAASASLGVSLTRRGVSRHVVFVTPRIGENEADSEWVQSVLAADTAVLYMAAGQSAGIAGALLAVGITAATPVVILENASLPNERRFATTLGGLPGVAEAAVISGPALIMLGEVFREAVASAKNDVMAEVALPKYRAWPL